MRQRQTGATLGGIVLALGGALLLLEVAGAVPPGPGTPAPIVSPNSTELPTRPPAPPASGGGWYSCFPARACAVP